MQHNGGGAFDPKTIKLLKAALDQAWLSLSPGQQAHTTKSYLAQRILKLAAQGERDPARLRRYAVATITTEMKISV
jgi:hypothetical protein